MALAASAFVLVTPKVIVAISGTAVTSPRAETLIVAGASEAATGTTIINRPKAAYIAFFMVISLSLSIRLGDHAIFARKSLASGSLIGNILLPVDGCATPPVRAVKRCCKSTE
jgi:hypothetical protein